jgi:hypothetical protein
MDNTVELDFFKSNIQSIIDSIENKRITTMGDVLNRLREAVNSKAVCDGDDYLINACDTVYTSFKTAYKVLTVDRVSRLIYLDDKQWHDPTSFYKNIAYKTKDGVAVSVGDTVYDEDVECVLEEYVGDGRFMVEGDCDPITVKCVYANPRCVSADGCVIYEGDYVYDRDGNRQFVMQTDVSDRSVQLKNSGWCMADTVYMKPHFPDEKSLLKEFERLSIEHTDSTIYEMFDAAKDVFGGNNG